MKIVFFSDAHGNQYSVGKFFSQIKLFDKDLVIFGGDIFGYYYGQLEVLSMLRENNCLCLLGNHDHLFLDLVEGKIDEDYLVRRYGSTYKGIVDRIPEEYIRYMYTLKYRYDLEVDGMHLVFVHGSIDNPLKGRVYPDTNIDSLALYYGTDYVFMGHTHHKLIKELPNGTILVNPGSIGQQRDGRGCSYVIFDTKKRNCSIQRIDYDKEKLINEVKSHHETEEMENRLMEVIYRNKS
ncbi:MAG: metallophosphatase family protein [Lachnospiraceae bacterium]|mgnify:CR=1 FL=1